MNIKSIIIEKKKRMLDSVISTNLSINRQKEFKKRIMRNKKIK